MSQSSSNPTLFRLRVRYVKRGRLAYLGHLEVLHTIERIVRRAGLPYAVTQGFSPHMRVGFSSALPVGTGSTCEWYDLFMTDLIRVEEALERLWAASPCDLEPVEAAYIDVRTPALTAQITRAVYRVELMLAEGTRCSPQELASAVETVRAKGELAYARGKKTKTMDLTRTFSGFDVEVAARGEAADLVLTLDTRCDNDGSLRPEILLAAVDAVLCGQDLEETALESTGIQDLKTFRAYRPVRISQEVEQQDGTFVDPLGNQ